MQDGGMSGEAWLDSYMIEQREASSTVQVSAQTIALFVSAFLSLGEESVAETEQKTITKVHGDSSLGSVLDQEDMNALTLFDAGGNRGGVLSPIRGKNEIWSDIEHEV